jgi:hypothetical protein
VNAGRVAEHPDRAGVRLEQARDELQERALAGAIGPDDREERPGRDGEVDVCQRDPPAIACGDVLEDDRRRRAGRDPPGLAWRRGVEDAGRSVVR